jgi:hypothetical protein
MNLYNWQAVFYDSRYSNVCLWFDSLFVVIINFNNVMCDAENTTRLIPNMAYFYIHII